MSQKKAKFNIVDIVVILVLIAGIAFVGMRMFGGGDETVVSDPSGSQPVRVTFFAEAVPEEVAATLVIGSSAENASRNVDLGHLVDFTTGESVCYGVNSEGEYVQSSKPGYVSVTMVCELSGIQQPTGLQVGQFMLNIGHSMGVRAGNTEINTYIINIEPVTAE